MLKKITTLLFAATIATSPALADSTTTQSKGKILLVASSANELTFKDGRKHPTGYYLPELSTPAQEFIKAGYEVVVATPDGNTPALDKNSLTESLFTDGKAGLDQAMRFVLTYPGMQKPKRLADVVKNELGSFDALYVPGGHAPMIDLMQNADLGKALKHFHENNKVTAMLCHGPIAFSAAMKNSKAFRQAMVNGDHEQAKKLASDWPYKGYNMTVYSTQEEYGVEDWLKAKIEFYMEDALRNAGANVTVGKPDQPYVVVDRELVTGQNPFSDHQLAKAVLEKLAEQKK